MPFIFLDTLAKTCSTLSNKVGECTHGGLVAHPEEEVLCVTIDCDATVGFKKYSPGMDVYS